MIKLLRIKPLLFIFIYVLVDTVCVGLGMGIPIFPILLGFPLGIYITKREDLLSKNESIYNNVFKISILTSLFTLILMIVIWSPQIPNIFSNTFNYSNFGIPMILYDPKISFVGWLVLMIIISPFLQLLTTIFGSFIVLSGKKK